jgi:hypothetical protein
MSDKIFRVLVCILFIALVIGDILNVYSSLTWSSQKPSIYGTVK